MNALLCRLSSSRSYSVTAVQSELFDSPSLLPLEGAEVRLYRGFIERAEAELWYEKLRQSLNWQQPEIIVAGRRHRIPRLQAWHGDDHAIYTYSKRTFVPEPWSSELTTLRQRVERICGERFNSVLVNFYRSGADGMGFHADDEPELGAAPVIASLSLGASRRFVFRPVAPGDKRRVEVDLGFGDLLIMAGRTQQNWHHGLPKTRRAVGGRINLTFRNLAQNPPQPK